MQTIDFFLQEFDTVRGIVDDLFLKGLTDDQLTHQPKEGLNSIAWLKSCSARSSFFIWR